MSKVNYNDEVVIVSSCASQGLLGVISVVYKADNKPCAIVKLENGQMRRYYLSSLRMKEEAMNVDWTMVGIRLKDGYNGKRLYFKSYEKEPLTKGEFCIVNTASGYQVGTVEVDAVERPTWTPTQDVVCRIDDAEYLRRRDSGRRVAELKDKMTARLKQVQETILFELLAPSDEELAALLAEYKEVTRK